MIKNCRKIAAILTEAAIAGTLCITPVFAEEQQGNLIIKDGVLVSAENCSGEVIIPDTVTSIAENAFDKKSAENITSIKIPGSVKTVRSLSYNTMEKLQKIQLGDGVEKIEEYTFMGCRQLTDVILPDSLQIIGRNAFAGCDNLKSITLPKNINRLEDYTFWKCSNLENITTSSQIEYFGTSAVDSTKWIEKCRDKKGFAIYNGILLDTDRSRLKGNIEIPESVTVINNNAFANADSITSITMSDSVKEIKDYAFEKCSNLKDLKLSNSLTKIGKFAFLNCRSLKDVKLPDTVEQMGERAFDKEVNLVGSGPNFEKVKAEMDAHYGDDFTLNLEEYPKGWIDIGYGYGSHRCYKADDNTLQKGWMDLDGDKYFFYDNGWMATGFLKHAEKDGDSPAFYYMDPQSGKLVTGWKKIDNKWYYFNPDANENEKKEKGYMQTGWMYSKGNWYYFNSDGSMATGLTIVDGTNYYFDESDSSNVGAMQTGWQNINGKWYYFKPETNENSEIGAMQTGWINSNGNWYYIYGDGTMATGFTKINNQDYYFDNRNTTSIGVMQTGWQNINKKWYYFGESSDEGIEGVMRRGWRNINGKWHYFYEDEGWMAVNTNVNGYHINEYGECV